MIKKIGGQTTIEFGTGDINIFINNARVISLNSSSARSIFDFETLYDLIQAGLVEKVEEKDERNFRRRTY